MIEFQVSAMTCMIQVKTVMCIKSVRLKFCIVFLLISSIDLGIITIRGDGIWD